jgi:hypothetical protein
MLDYADFQITPIVEMSPPIYIIIFEM